MIMKRRNLFYSLSFVLSLSSCSRMEEFPIDSPVLLDVIATRSASDDTYDVLGYGYDITEEYMGENSTKLRVLDIAAFDRENSGRFEKPFIGIIDQKVTAGEDTYSFLKNITTNTNFSGSIGSIGKEVTDSGFFSGTISAGFKSNTKYSYSSKYSFAKAEVFKKQRRYFLNTDLETLKRYLSPVFVEDLKRYSADKIIKLYGTHVLTNIIIGGKYVAYYKSAIIDKGDRSEKTKTVSAGVKFNLSRIGLDANGTWDRTEIIEQNRNNSNWECYIKSLGGSTSGTTISLNPNQGPTFTINLGDWSKSVDDQHSVLLDVDWNATYPIYELISDPVKKQEMKDAVLRYIDSKKLEVIKLTPVYRYYSEKYVNHSYWPNWKGESFQTDRYEGILGYMCEKQLPGTRPVYRYYSDKYVNHSLWTNWRGEVSQTDRYEGILGYIYTTQVSGTVPVYRYYSEKFVNHSYWTNWKGEVSQTDHYEGILGYIYPSDI